MSENRTGGKNDFCPRKPVEIRMLYICEYNYYYIGNMHVIFCSVLLFLLLVIQTFCQDESLYVSKFNTWNAWGDNLVRVDWRESR